MYFKDCKNMNSLRKEYLKLIKKHHPDLASNDDDFELRTRICKEINLEYDMLAKFMPKVESMDNKNESNIPSLSGNVDYSRRSYIDWHKAVVNNSAAAEQAYNNIIINLQKPNIGYKYYSRWNEGPSWKEELVLKEMDATISF